MRVIGVGFGRTGTASTKAALERLGFDPCHHGFEVMEHTALTRRWVRVLSGERVPWDEVFAGYDATVDWPAAAYWKELVDAFPDAKVLLTVRDPDKWYDSMRTTLWARPPADQPLPVRERLSYLLFALSRPTMMRYFRLLSTELGELLRGDAPPSRERAIELFDRHVAEVQAHVPADRLLTFEVKQGWEPLCRFLDVPVPDEEFPRVNDAGALERWTKDFRRRNNRRALALAGSGLLTNAALAAGSAIRRRRHSSIG